MIFKVAARLDLERIPLLTVNYAVAFVLSTVSISTGGHSFEPSPGLVALGVITGILFILSFFVLALSTAEAGMSLSLAVMRLSVVIPFAASWVFWDEIPTHAQLVAVVLAGVGFFLISGRGRSGGTITLRSSLLLGALFLMGGTSDTFMKTFDEIFAPSQDRAVYMTMLFGVAFLSGLVISVTQKKSFPRRQTLLLGAALGMVNFGSVEFLLNAVGKLSGTFVFPAINISLVVGGAVLGVVVWKERLSRGNLVGLGLALAALILLNR